MSSVVWNARQYRYTSLVLISLLTLLPCPISAEAVQTELKNLELLGFLPMTGKGWVGGAACLPAVNMALRHVNERPGLLDGYNLTYSWVDSQVIIIIIIIIIIVIIIIIIIIRCLRN